MARDDGRVLLYYVDINVDDVMAIVVALPKVSCVTWTKSQRMALLYSCRVEVCNPVSKRTNKNKIIA